MEIRATPFPGKSQPLKSKTNRNITEARKINAKEPPIHRQRRVFGTLRNPNVTTAKTVPEKPMIKPSIGASQKQRKSSQTSPSTNNVRSAKKSPEKNKPRPKKKSVCFQENVVENSAKALPDVDISTGLRTPVRSPSLIKTRVSGTPYHSAEKCSKCRFDKLETSSYWLAQIKLAESVAKHFVSAAFFRLAFESKSEPIRSLGVELKHYLGRHQYLSAETEWRGVSLSYGLIKDESNAEGADSSLGKINTGNATDSVLDQEQNDLKEQPMEQSENRRY